jgi:hypothetical protein
MAFLLLQPPLYIPHGFFPRLDLDFPVPDEPTIGMRPLLLKSDLDSMIRNPSLQTFQSDSQLLVTSHASP